MIYNQPFTISKNYLNLFAFSSLAFHWGKSWLYTWIRSELRCYGKNSEELLANPVDGLRTRMSSLIRKGPPINLLPQRSRFTPRLARLSAFLLSQWACCDALSVKGILKEVALCPGSVCSSLFSLLWLLNSVVGLCETSRAILSHYSQSILWWHHIPGLSPGPPFLQSSQRSHHRLLAGAHDSTLTLLYAHPLPSAAHSHTPDSQRLWAACICVKSLQLYPTFATCGL